MSSVQVENPGNKGQILWVCRKAPTPNVGNKFSQLFISITFLNKESKTWQTHYFFWLFFFMFKSYLYTYIKYTYCTEKNAVSSKVTENTSLQGTQNIDSVKPPKTKLFKN